MLHFKGLHCNLTVPCFDIVLLFLYTVHTLTQFTAINANIGDIAIYVFTFNILWGPKVTDHIDSQITLLSLKHTRCFWNILKSCWDYMEQQTSHKLMESMTALSMLSVNQ